MVSLVKNFVRFAERCFGSARDGLMGAGGSPRREGESLHLG